jgi:hypothetical protein
LCASTNMPPPPCLLPTPPPPPPLPPPPPPPPPPAPVSRLVLELRGEQVEAGQQLGLFTPQLARAGRLDWQLVGLSLRFGSDRLLRARTLDPEATVPEGRTTFVPATSR